MLNTAAPMVIVLDQATRPHDRHQNTSLLRAIPIASAANLVFGPASDDAAVMVADRTNLSGVPPRPSLVDRHMHPTLSLKSGTKFDRQTRRVTTSDMKKAKRKSEQTSEPPAPRFNDDVTLELDYLAPAFHLGRVNATLQRVTEELEHILLDRRTAPRSYLDERVPVPGGSLSRRSILRLKTRALIVERRKLMGLKPMLQRTRKGTLAFRFDSESVVEVFRWELASAPGTLLRWASEPHVRKTTLTPPPTKRKAEAVEPVRLKGGTGSHPAGTPLFPTSKAEQPVDVGHSLPTPSLNGFHKAQPRPSKIVSVPVTLKIQMRATSKKEAAARSLSQAVRKQRWNAQQETLAERQLLREEKLVAQVAKQVDEANALRTAPTKVKAKAKKLAKAAASLEVGTKMGYLHELKEYERGLSKAARRQELKDRRFCEATGVDYELLAQLADNELLASCPDDFLVEAEERITESVPKIQTKHLCLRVSDDELVERYADA